MQQPTERPLRTRRILIRSTLAAALAAAVAQPMMARPAASSSGAGWPGLRGPHFDGGVDAVLFADDAAAADGGAALEVGWKRSLGSGYSAVAVGDGVAITMFADGGHDVIAAFDTATGEERWRDAIAPTYTGHDGSHDGPIATPLLDGGQVFAVGPRGHVLALDAETGARLWATHLVDDHGAEKPHYGFTTSPLTAGGVLVVQVGGGAGASLVGFDRLTGEEIWRAGAGAVVYHTPIRTTLAGREQVVAATRESVMGVDPADGTVLWQYAHGGDDAAMGGDTIIPVPAGEDRLLLLNQQDASLMLRVDRAGTEDDHRIEELWSSNTLRGTYVHPVVHEGYLYGMAGRIFTCVDAATGERMWRSREPGDGFLTRVGDHLVMLTKTGSLHIIAADPARYREVARLDLFADHAWSAVAYADGHLFARSLGELARIDPVRATPVEQRAGMPSTGGAGAFARFLAEVEHADDKAAAVDRFLGSQASFPIVESAGLVHFVYRGSASDVGIVGDMIGYRREEPMTRVPGTDLFYHSMLLEPDAAVSYGFIVDFAEPVADPRNDHAGRGLFGDVSWLAMPAWRPPSLANPEAEPAGRVEEVTWTSAARGGKERAASVYVPPGYDDAPGRRYPTVYVHHGRETLEQGEAVGVLDRVIGHTVEPVITVFVLPDGNPRRDMGDRAAYQAMLVDELVPLVDRRFRTIVERLSRATAGVGAGGTAAIWSALEHPETFGKVAAHAAFVMGSVDELGEAVARSGDRPTVVYQAWGTYHLRSPHEAWDEVAANRALQQHLRARGLRPTGGEVAEGYGWWVWKARIDDWLEALFPLGRHAGE